MAITALNENWDKHRTKTYGGGTLWSSISLRSSLWTLRSSPRRHRIFALHEAIPLLHVEQALSPGVVECSEQLYTIHIYIICCLCCVYVYNIYIYNIRIKLNTNILSLALGSYLYACLCGSHPHPCGSAAQQTQLPWRNWGNTEHLVEISHFFRRKSTEQSWHLCTVQSLNAPIFYPNHGKFTKLSYVELQLHTI